MCNIAGYTGYKNAAPILIDMIRRQETLDGGLSTGIATIHKGELYYAKVTGNVDELIKKTSALDFPGTTGIIHSRPDNNYVEYAHPFLCEDGKTAACSNGNLCNDKHLVTVRNSMAQYLVYQHNVTFESGRNFSKSSYPQLKDGRYVAYGELFAKTVENCRTIATMSYDEAMADVSGKLFSDVVNVLVSANSPDTIYVTRISRPMNILSVPGETYIATSQFGFPDEVNKQPIKSLPQMKSCVISKDGFKEAPYTIAGGTVTDYTPEEYTDIKENLRQKLKKEPTSMDTIGGGIITDDRTAIKLRPHVKVIYDALWDLYNEGVLKSKIDDFVLPWTLGTKAKRTFFYI